MSEKKVEVPINTHTHLLAHRHTKILLGSHCSARRRKSTPCTLVLLAYIHIHSHKWDNNHRDYNSISTFACLHAYIHMYICAYIWLGKCACVIPFLFLFFFAFARASPACHRFYKLPFFGH